MMFLVQNNPVAFAKQPRLHLEEWGTMRCSEAELGAETGPSEPALAKEVSNQNDHTTVPVLYVLPLSKTYWHRAAVLPERNLFKPC